MQFKVEIKVSADKVWQILWQDETYRKWTKVFNEGSYAVTDEWKEGTKVHFLSPDGRGMYSLIASNKPKEFMSLKHLGEINDFKEIASPETKIYWDNAYENYTLTETGGNTLLVVDLIGAEEYESYFNDTFPKALVEVKNLSEAPYMLTVEATINAPMDMVWNAWTNPEHIMQWNNASEDWHTPFAENDLTVGGKFLYRMAAKDGSFSFDFIGTYTEVIEHQKISYTMGDGRLAEIYFSEIDNQIQIKEVFEAECENSLVLQAMGWQSILNNFQHYVESKLI